MTDLPFLLKVLTLLLPVLAIAVSSAPPEPKPVALQDKTLVVWVAPANLTQRGGSVLTVDDQHGHFDGIVFGELTPAKWMAGSDFYRRTERQQSAWPVESADAHTQEGVDQCG